MNNWLTTVSTQIFIKAGVSLERLYTFLKRGVEKDPTDLIGEFYPAVEFLNFSQHKKNQAQKLGVIVPFRDRWDMTLSCLKSLEVQTFEPGIELNLYLVNNGSLAQETKEGLEDFKKKYSNSSSPLVKVLDIDIPFNFSILCNHAANHADKDGCSHVLLLNNDIEFEDPGTIQHLLSTMVNLEISGRRVGAVGCTLLYPNRSVQHLYVAPGVKIIAAHPGKGLKFNPKHLWQQGPRQVPAVTGALMLTSMDSWRAVGGLDENLPSSGQDVDYCLKLAKSGYEIFVPGKVYATHKEGVSRGKHIARKDVQYMYERWPELWAGGHPKLSFWSEKPCLKLISQRFPWKRLLRN